MTDTAPDLSPEAAGALLQWYVAAGVDTVESTIATDFADWPAGGVRLAVAAPPAPSPSPSARTHAVNPDDAPVATDQAIADAQAAAVAATSLEELDAAIRGFDGCALKPGARNTVVYDGVFRSPVLIIGEAPGKDEDRVGKPFIGKAGGLLDKMLAAIGISRTPDDGLIDACITNSIYWRPPGNRTPTKAETAICLPFVERFISLSAPKVIVLTGNAPTQALFPDLPGITRSRGKWQRHKIDGGGDVPCLPMFHPAFLLRQAVQKRLAWADLLAIKQSLHDG